MTIGQIVLAAFGYVLCVIASAGMVYAYFYEKYPLVRNHRAGLGTAFLISLGGPISLVMVWFLSGFAEHGWRLRPRANGW